MAGRQKTKFEGVYQRTSSRRRYAGRPDVCFDITYKDFSGKKRWEKVGYKSEGYTAQMARNIRSERLRQLRHGDMPARVVGKDIPFSEAWLRFKKVHLPTLKHEEDAKITTLRYKKHLEPRIGDIPMSKISPLTIEKMKTKLMENYAPATVCHILGIVRQVYNKAISWGLWNGPVPTAGIKMPKADNERARWLEVSEADALLDKVKAKSEQAYHMSLSSLHTGMRFSEVAGLRGEHVDMINKFIRITESKNYKGRNVPMTDELYAIMKTLPLTRGELVFKSAKGAQMKRISRSFPRAVADLKLNDGIIEDRDKVVFHSLRHTFASWLAIEGVPLYVISKLLGHKSLEMTQRYAHLCPDVHDQALKALSHRLASQRSSSQSEQPTEPIQQ